MNGSKLTKKALKEWLAMSISDQLFDHAIKLANQ